MRIRTYLPDVLVLLAGALYPFSFAPFGFSWLAILSLAAFIVLLRGCTPMRGALRGWLFGLSSFGIGVSWIYISIHDYGNAIAPVAAFITAGFIMLLSLFPAAVGYVAQRYFHNLHPFRYIINLPAIWVLAEWLRSFLFTGFPWLLIGHSQINSVLSGLLPLVGVFGTGFAAAMCSGLIAWWIDSKRRWHVPAFALLVAVLATCWLFSRLTWTYPEKISVKVALVQGNIPQNLKWQPGYLQDTFDRYEQLTQLHWEDDIIFWPEAAIPIRFGEARPFIDMMDRKAKEHDAGIIIGAPVRTEDKEHYYNAALAIGFGSGHYYKQHLVPFGEYIPFNWLLRGALDFFNLPISTFVPGNKNQTLIVSKHRRIGTFICYEIAYNETVRRTLPDAEFLVVMSNDAWFGDSIAPAQHLQIAQVQAKQTGRYVLFVANDGITAVITPEGEIQSRLPQHKTMVLTDTIRVMSGTTPWVIWGDWFIILEIVLVMFIANTYLKYGALLKKESRWREK